MRRGGRLQAYVWLDLAVAEALTGFSPGDTSLARESVGAHLAAAQLASAKARAATLKAKVGAEQGLSRRRGLTREQKRNRTNPEQFILEADDMYRFARESLALASVMGFVWMVCQVASYAG